MKNAKKTSGDNTAAEAEDYKKIPYIMTSSDKEGGHDIQIKNLTVRIPDDHGNNGRALTENINLTIKKGDRVILTGESGSGKTTLAKAILNQWDYGSGLITMPEGIKIILIAQQAYFPDTTLRSIMNLMPDDQATFADKDLTRVLQKVGLDTLIQHIPGQQVEILMDDLLEKVPAIVKSFAEDGEISDTGYKAIKLQIFSHIAPLVSQQFEVVQYTPEAQRNYFKGKFKEALESALGKALPQNKIDELTKSVLNEIDIELTRPLYNHLTKSIPDMARKKRGKIFSHTQQKNDFLSQKFSKKMQKRLIRFINNKDTDDSNRDIRINKAQTEYIVSAMSQNMRDELDKHNESVLHELTNKTIVRPLAKVFNKLAQPLTENIPTKLKKTLGTIFNTVSAPVHWTTFLATWSLRKAFNVVTWPLKPFQMTTPAENVLHDTTYFMTRQVVTGSQFSNSGRLSGGQKQKLLAAIGLLHDAQLYVFDEPTASLDQSTAEEVYGGLMNSIQKDTSVLCITHDEYLIKHHTHHAHLANQKITVKEVKPNDASAEVCPTCPHVPKRP